MSSNTNSDLANIENNIIVLEPNLSLHSLTDNQVCYVVYPEDLQLKPPTPIINGTKRGRPRKVHKKQVIENIEIEDTSGDEISLKVWRTRSGRMTKPPKHIAEVNLLKPSNDSDKEEPMVLEENKNISTEIKSNKRKRNISSQYRCTTCKKAYLGRIKMSKHLQLNPTHIAPSINSVSDENNAWLDLIKRLKSVPKNYQPRILFEEFVNFLNKAREIIPSLLKPVNESDSCIVVDQLISNSLGIAKGCYTFVDNTVTNILINQDQNVCHFNSEIGKGLKNDSTVSDASNQNKNMISSDINEHNFLHQNKKTDDDNRSSDTSNDQSNLLLNLLDSGQVTFDSASSDDVVNMEQLINERLKTLTDGVIDHSSSQSLNLDLSLDMFSYHGT